MTASLRTLLSELIDYAGLFPPAQLGMARAVKNYAEYLCSEESWMLGRFILPVSRFREFLDCAEKYLEKTEKPWKISALAGEDIGMSVKAINEFNRNQEGRAVIDTMEAKAVSASDVKAAAKMIPENLTTFFEVSMGSNTPDLFTELALTRQRAKIRTGGVTTDAFPSPDEVVKFMRICIAANVPFKATAGLHHPLRCMKPLTYEPDAATGMMHGFLNVFLTACFLRQNLNNPAVYRLMVEDYYGNVEFTDEGIRWNDHSVDLKTVELARARNAISFGSCSFTEPVDDLKELGFI